MASTAVETDVFVNKTLSNLCPYMNFCHRNASKVPEDDEHKPCCAPCSCEDDCFELESCCPDKVSSHPQAAPLTCKASEVKRVRGLSGPSPFPLYRVVDTCPVGERNLTLVQKCRGENRTDIKDYQWVSDKRTGRIFQNHYCARCHDYDQIEVWDIQTGCIQALQAGFKCVADILTNHIYCNIVNVAPDSFETLVQKYICSDEKGVPKCKEIGASLNHSDACATLWLPYFSKNNIHRNVYCYMCSDYFQFESVPEVCEKSDGESRTDTNFQLLLNFRNLKDEDDSDATVCDIDEIFDIRLNLCLKLHCPLGSSPFRGRCTEFLLKSAGVTVLAHYQLRVMWDEPNLDVEGMTVNGTELGMEVYTKFMKTLSKNNKCSSCLHYFLMRPNTENDPFGVFLLLSTFATTATCPLEVLLASLRKPIDKQIKVKSKEIGTINVLVTLIPDDKLSAYYLNRGAVQITYGTSIWCAGIKFSLKNQITCPEVEVPLSQVLSIPNHTLKERLLSLFENKTQQDERNLTDLNITEVLHICIDKYVALSHDSATGVRLVDLRGFNVIEMIAHTLILLMFIY